MVSDNFLGATRYTLGVHCALTVGWQGDAEQGRAGLGGEEQG